MKIANIIRAILPAIGFSCFVVSAIAQAPVSDISTSSRRAAVAEGYSAGTTAGSVDAGAIESGSMFQQFQQLQQEVSTLRGQLEEQAYELQKLKQQHQDDFANLDRRLAGGSTSTGSTATDSSAQSGVAGATTGNTAIENATASNSDGKEEYEAAYAKLKAKDYPGATSAFKAFVGKYPNSDYAGNSWFWLGFVYQTQGDAESAAKSFASLIERFPNHSKVDDAKYNLGKIYNQQGKTEQARALLKEVASGDSKSAPLAKSYLESM
jgi:tol-pal system protein YbgF